MNIEFVVHTDCDIPCIHMVVSKDGQVVSDHEAPIEDYINLISQDKLVEYSAALAAGFRKIVDFIAENNYNINSFNSKIQDMIAISKKKTEVDAILYPPQQESENNNV